MVENTIFNTFVIHVPSVISRKIHMNLQLNKQKLKATFIEDGDISDLSPLIMEKYFSGELAKPSAATSCAYKHILAYKHIVNNNLTYALILEDDIFLHSNFNVNLTLILNEIKKEKITNFIISLEDSNLKFIPKSKQKKDTMLYKKTMGRMAGAYLIDLDCAKSICNYIEKNTCYLPIDWYHNELSKLQKISIWWAQPAIASQGSLNGKIASSIDKKPINVLKQILFGLKKQLKLAINNIS